MTTEAHPRAAKASVPATHRHKTQRHKKASGFWADHGWALTSVAIGLSIWEIISRFLIGNKLFFCLLAHAITPFRLHIGTPHFLGLKSAPLADFPASMAYGHISQ